MKVHSALWSEVKRADLMQKNMNEGVSGYLENLCGGVE